MASLTVQKIVALLIAATGAFVLVEGLALPYYGLLGPGSGFMPTWVGAAVTGLALLLLAQSFIGTDDQGAFLAAGQSFRRPVVMGAACLALVIILPLLGFRLAMLVFLLAVPNILGRQRVLPMLVFAVLGSFGTAFVFEKLLLVRLPAAGLPILSGLGF